MDPGATPPTSARPSAPWPSASWPSATWPTATRSVAERRGLDAIVGAAFEDPGTIEDLGPTQALAIVHDGRLVLERYAPELDASTTLASWSIAKSVMHAVTGIMVGDGLVTVDDVITHPVWVGARASQRPPISIRHALEMRDGLRWNERYDDVGTSDVKEMLWGRGRRDMARYVAERPVAHLPGTTYAYSSGTTNLLSFHLSQVLRDHGADMAGYLATRLFAPLGMHRATPKFDAAGTWIASTYCFATAQDFLRFGLLYLRDGNWAGQRILPAGWVAAAATPQPDVLDEGWGYGRHWWTLPNLPGAFFANGFAGQFILVVPEHELVVVRLGTSPTGASPRVAQHLCAVVAAAAIATARG